MRKASVSIFFIQKSNFLKRVDHVRGKRGADVQDLIQKSNFQNWRETSACRTSSEVEVRLVPNAWPPEK